MSRFIIPFAVRISAMIFILGIFPSKVFSDETRKVRQGETVYQLSREYGIPVEVLLEVNKISDPSDIPTGQELTIPTDSTVIYKVQKGDTLYSIAHKFGLNLYELKNYNKGISDNIQIGQSIHVPSRQEIARADSQVDKDERINTSAYSTQTQIRSNNRSSANLQSFGDVVSSSLFEDSKYIGSVSQQQWPLAGKAYLLEGKLPGVLIRGNRGDAVQASKPGLVVYASRHTSFNNVVVVQGYDNIVYVYAGQETLQVKQGDSINKGSMLGKLGVMPTVQEAMLYFSAWKKDKFQDPRKLIAHSHE